MSSFSRAQIEQLWISNGGNPAWAPTMAGISAEENHAGDPSVINNNPSTRDYSVGLWQINYFGSLLGPRTAAYGSPATLQADPNAQAAAAIKLLGNGSGLSNWHADAVARAAAAAGGPLTDQQVQQILNEQGIAGGTGSGAASSANLANLPTAEGPRWLGLTTPSRCVFGNFSLFGSSFCLVTAAQARKIKGYTVMTIGGLGLVLGIGLVAAIGLRSGAGRQIASAGRKIPGPVGLVSRSASSSSSGPGRVRVESAQYRAGQRQNPVRFEGRGRARASSADVRELADRRAEDDRRRRVAAEHAQERREGFNLNPPNRRPDTRRGRAA